MADTTPNKRGPYAKRLKNAQDARRWLAFLVKETYLDRIDASKAGRLGYLLNLYLKACETADFDARLTAIEERLQAMNGHYAYPTKAPKN